MKVASISAILLALSLSGCGQPEPTEVQKAERRYQHAERTGTKADQCREGKRLIEARVEAGETAGFEQETRLIEVECGMLETERVLSAQ